MQNIHSFDRDDYVFLASSFCMMMLHAFELLATTKYDAVKNHVIYGASLTELICDQLTDFYQTVLLIQIRHYKLKQSRGYGLSGVCCYLYITNGLMWALYSLFLIKCNDIASIPADIYGHDYWMSLLHYILPMCCFFRFHSFYFFYKLSNRFQPPTENQNISEQDTSIQIQIQNPNERTPLLS